jgi:hypothetical protein
MAAFELAQKEKQLLTQATQLLSMRAFARRKQLGYVNTRLAVNNRDISTIRLNKRRMIDPGCLLEMARLVLLASAAKRQRAMQTLISLRHIHRHVCIIALRRLRTAIVCLWQCTRRVLVALAALATGHPG